ncbi:DMT family transporter [Sporosarcina sp. Te-1]|uniref:DMT family transporter n=1 Tax=Sporosarcina sp. Te-1 TaxID=2818390 RepID=UPI001A9F32C5|nr:DMT family transporter [Sporosarcina sp. Te-1]
MHNYKYLGGLLGAIYIAVIAFSVTKISVHLAVISAVFGQMVMSALIDHFGWFQIQSNPVNIQRIFGLILLFISMILIYRGSIESN